MAYRGGPPGRGMGGPPRGVPQTMSQAEQGMASNQSMPGPDKKIRYFIALFDYDPTTMSPNPDACEEELPFNEGDSIKVRFIYLFLFEANLRQLM